MECIACTQCIDACDAIMDQIGKPHGLIRYTSENALEGQKTRLLRGRTVLYGLLFVVLSSIFTIALTSRSAYDVNVGRAVGEPYTVLPDGNVANRLRFRVRNQTPQPVSFEIAALAPAGAELRVVGVSPIELAPQEMKRTEVWVVVPPDVFEAGQRAAAFVLRFDNGTEVQQTFLLLGPSP